MSKFKSDEEKRFKMLCLSLEKADQKLMKYERKHLSIIIKGNVPHPVWSQLVAEQTDIVEAIRDQIRLKIALGKGS